MYEKIVHIQELKVRSQSSPFWTKLYRTDLIFCVVEPQYASKTLSAIYYTTKPDKEFIAIGIIYTIQVNLWSPMQAIRDIPEAGYIDY